MPQRISRVSQFPTALLTREQLHYYKTDPNYLKHFRFQSSPRRSISDVLLDIINQSKSTCSVLVFVFQGLNIRLPPPANIARDSRAQAYATETALRTLYP